MKRFLFIMVLVWVTAALLTACGGVSDGTDNMPLNNPNEPVNSDMPADDEPGLPQGVEGPIVNLPGETPYQDLEREPGQAQLVPGNAVVSSAQLLVMESFPVQVSLELSGELPTPCNILTIDISEPDEDDRISVEVYSLIDPAMTCIQMIEQFSTVLKLPLDDLEDGTYEVVVNGELVGQFKYPG